MTVLCQGVDGIHWRMELKTSTEVQLPHVSPVSCVLPDERAVLIELYLSSISVVHQTVITV